MILLLAGIALLFAAFLYARAGLRRLAEAPAASAAHGFGLELFFDAPFYLQVVAGVGLFAGGLVCVGKGALELWSRILHLV